MPRYKLLVSYDGTGYLGWQKTRFGPSIQEKLQKALLVISKEPILPEAASRTDKGVHAEGQIVSFALSSSWNPKRLLTALNAHLPEDIRIIDSAIVASEFHPTLDAVKKSYRYVVDLEEVQSPEKRAYAWHYFYPVDLSKMEKGAQMLVGTRDFSTFSNRKEKNPLCTLFSIDFWTLNGSLTIEMTGDRFLYKMARNLAGTLLYIGSGKLPLESLPDIIASLDRKKAGITAPASGLFLHKVLYEDTP